jgi:putative DNA primase/helicase
MTVQLGNGTPCNSTTIAAADALRMIPAELRERPQWVSWKYLNRDGKPTKVPINPRTGRNGSSTDSATWGTFDEATAAVERFKLCGIGFVFSADDPYLGIDLDACRNPATGELTPWADRIVNKIPGYWEVSPSGYGIKGIVRATLKPGHNVKKLKDVPTFGDKPPEIALYDQSRFWCLTGEAV